MDVAGVAEYLGFSPSTIYEKVQTKDIPHVRIGNSLRFPKAVIDRWLEEYTVQPMANFYTRFVKMASAFFGDFTRSRSPKTHEADHSVHASRSPSAREADHPLHACRSVNN
jgi:excisionase family DNA binding protein